MFHICSIPIGKPTIAKPTGVTAGFVAAQGCRVAQLDGPEAPGAAHHIGYGHSVPGRPRHVDASHRPPRSGVGSQPAVSSRGLRHVIRHPLTERGHEENGW